MSVFNMLKQQDDIMSNGESSGPVYQVQVKTRDQWPAFAVGAMIIDQRWQDLELAPSVWPVGVPTPHYAMQNLEFGATFVVAEAQRWIFIALVESMRGVSPIETRIVERKVTRTWKCEEVGEVKEVPGWTEDHNIWKTPSLTKGA